MSLMFYNINGLRMGNLISGNFDWLQADMIKRKQRSLLPDYPRDPEEVYRWLAACGFEAGEKTGIRVFHDYLRDKNLQTEQFDQLLALETQYSCQRPFLDLGRYIRVAVYKPVREDER